MLGFARFLIAFERKLYWRWCRGCHWLAHFGLGVQSVFNAIRFRYDFLSAADHVLDSSEISAKNLVHVIAIS